MIHDIFFFCSFSAGQAKGDSSGNWETTDESKKKKKTKIEIYIRSFDMNEVD